MYWLISIELRLIKNLILYDRKLLDKNIGISKISIIRVNIIKALLLVILSRKVRILIYIKLTNKSKVY